MSLPATIIATAPWAVPTLNQLFGDDMERAAGKYMILSGGAIAIVLSVFYSCRKPYSPKAISAGDVHYLVVEGVINPGSDLTIIKLSRTVKIDSKTSANPESNAQVAVESDDNGVYTLNENGPGQYTFAGLNLDNSRKYRLRIKTSNGEEYLSDLVDVKITPPIDSVGFNVLKDSLQVYVNTHDPTDKTRYYRWDFDETWQFHARYPSLYYSDGTKLLERDVNHNIYYCYGSDSSPDIVLGSTAKLSHDVVYEGQISMIRGTSEKVEREYSILLRQYALTEDGFKYWQILKKNTEQLGSIFAVQPSELTGNVHCISNPLLPAIGYVSICTVQSKRVFITNYSFPDTWQPIYPYTCGIDSIKTNLYDNLIRPGSGLLALDPIGDYRNPSGYTATTVECADCTIRGTTTRPDFWK
ncbi:DUF4249 domain-containing protein [Mucilaginibacter sp.]|uniref:DUF4249 domain-containing protein n=1 Tax=Mucilaginibacter sp. TaxID=1882438 RepID=UPI002B9C4C3E|nr:DUF4249 domain-containing protein [Mucilaginibacter sp.]HTI60323.1 DUF4249 domain-containing protein [Mucilaginibacter sp.]